MKKSFLLILFICTSMVNFAQEKALKDLAASQALSSQVVALFFENKVLKAIDLLVPYWPIPEEEIEDFTTKTIKYMNLFDQSYGKPIGSLKVKNEKIAEIAVRETYLIQYENTAIRLIFTYYKNKKGWIVNSFKWDDSFKEEFK